MYSVGEGLGLPFIHIASAWRKNIFLLFNFPQLNFLHTFSIKLYTIDNFNLKEIYVVYHIFLNLIEILRNFKFVVLHSGEQHLATQTVQVSIVINPPYCLVVASI